MSLHRIISLVVAFSVGIMLALFAFDWIANPEPAMQRAREEAVVHSSREILRSYIADDVETVDPLETDRAVGKAYIYPTEDGWEVSGHYRRDENDRWHPFLMALDEDAALITLTVRDGNARLAATARNDPKLVVAE